MQKRSKLDWIELVEGIILILLGIFTFIYPDSLITGLVIIYGIVAVITGIVDIVVYVKIERHTGFGPILSLVTGILSVMAGIMLLTYPGAGTWIVAFLFPLWFITHCISRLSHLNLTRRLSGNFAYWFSLIVNILGLVLGFMMIVSPWLSLMSAAYTAGIYLILLGIESVIMSIRKY